MKAAAPITIGMPVYNGEPFLGPAIDSILGQTFGDFVLVVSDNGSSDATGEIVRSYADRDERVRYLHSPENRGAAWNYNRVFAECNSPFFKWAASDDVLAPTCVERCFELLRDAPPTVVLVFPQTRLIGPDGAALRDVDDRMHLRETTPHARLGHVVKNVIWGNLVFGLVVSDALRRTRGHGSYPSSDWVLLAELALLGQFWQVPEPLFYRRMHDGMSRKANTTTREVAQWFDPSNDGNENELRRVFVEHFAAIKRTPLSRVERSLCYQTLVWTFTRRHVDVTSRLRSLVTRDGR